MAGIVEEHQQTSPIKAVLDSYNPVGSTRQVRFTTSKRHPLGDRRGLAEADPQRFLCVVIYISGHPGMADRATSRYSAGPI